MLCPACRSENAEGFDVCFQCGKSLVALVRGTVLANRYEIVSVLGRGGMGVVYKAHDRELDETVAIKTLRAEALAAPELARRFRTEVKLARTVSHRNVCRIHEFGREGHLGYLVMEFVDGMDVKRRLREVGRLPAPEAYEIAIAVAEALHAIHEVGVVHRDLKTPNIMRDRNGVVKLMDFGIAKRFQADTTSATQSGLILGTPEYMSPEQARAEKLDPRSDLYALGVVTFEMFTATLPFRGETPGATLLQQMQMAPALETEGIPPALRPVLQKALAKSREARFSSALEMSVGLRRAREQAPAGADDAWPTRAAVALPRDPEEIPTTPVPAPLPSLPTVPTALVPSTRRSKAATRVTGLLAAAALIVTAAAATRWGRRGEEAAAPGHSESTLPPIPSAAAATLPVHAEAPTPPAPTAPVKAAAAPTRPGVARPRLVVAAVGASPTTTLATSAPVVTASPEPAPSTPSPTALPSPVAAQPGSLRITSKPTAEITIDGRAAGKTPLQLPAMPAGKHVIVFEHPSYEPLRRVVDIEPGRPVELKVDLRDEAMRRKGK